MTPEQKERLTELLHKCPEHPHVAGRAVTLLPSDRDVLREALAAVEILWADPEDGEALTIRFEHRRRLDAAMASATQRMTGVPLADLLLAHDAA